MEEIKKDRQKIWFVSDTHFGHVSILYFHPLRREACGVTLEELQEEINENGAMIKYQSGNGFDTIRDNPAQKAYTTMISRYTGIIDQLNKMLPSDKIMQNNDELLDFLKSNS